MSREAKAEEKRRKFEYERDKEKQDMQKRSM